MENNLLGGTDNDGRIQYPGRYLADPGESISEISNSHRLIIAIDYGTTFTSKYGHTE